MTLKIERRSIIRRRILPVFVPPPWGFFEPEKMPYMTGVKYTIFLYFGSFLGALSLSERICTCSRFRKNAFDIFEFGVREVVNFWGLVIERGEGGESSSLFYVYSPGMNEPIF